MDSTKDENDSEKNGWLKIAYWSTLDIAVIISIICCQQDKKTNNLPPIFFKNIQYENEQNNLCFQKHVNNKIMEDGKEIIINNNYVLEYPKAYLIPKGYLAREADSYVDDNGAFYHKVQDDELLLDNLAIRNFNINIDNINSIRNIELDKIIIGSNETLYIVPKKYYDLGYRIYSGYSIYQPKSNNDKVKRKNLLLKKSH